MTTSRDQAPDLFGSPEGKKSVEAPLAERLRPRWKTVLNTLLHFIVPAIPAFNFPENLARAFLPFSKQ